ncbi:MAG: tRNA1(Val) (adenine(37)-N6)-methyltransferase [Clostridia bacterium]|nr:tRNA1(Val) (adenine(37)-N6)-methyltransferase [Clostridia bacterium]
MMIFENECIDDLQINNLRIIQKTDGFKFGIDAVLLSDFAKNTPSKRTLDLCTGTGIIPLLLSAKTNTLQIYGLEIQPEICNMAQRSVLYNKLENRIHIDEGDLNNACELYGKCSFDKITCNPPYMECGTGIINNRDSLTVSRHEIKCTLEDVIRISSQLLKQKGHLFMVHRPSRLADIMCLMRKYKIEPKTLRFVHPSSSKAPNLLLVEGVRCGGKELKLLPPLYVYNEGGTYTEEIDIIYNRKED